MSRSVAVCFVVPSKKGFRIQGHDPDAAKFLIKPDDPLLSLTRLISQNDIVSLRDVKRSSPPRSDATCFHTVLAGSGHLQVTVTPEALPVAFGEHAFCALRCSAAQPHQQAWQQACSLPGQWTDWQLYFSFTSLCLLADIDRGLT